MSCQNKEHQTSQGSVPSGTDQQVRSESVWPRHPRRESYSQQRTSVGVLGREGFHLYFSIGHSLLPVNVPFSLVVEAVCSLCLIGHRKAVLVRLKFRLIHG